MFPVAIAEGQHPFPFRTRSLSPPAPMVLSWSRDGRVGRCRDFFCSRPQSRASSAPCATALRPARTSLDNVRKKNAGRSLHRSGISHVLCAVRERVRVGTIGSRCHSFRAWSDHPAEHSLDDPIQSITHKSGFAQVCRWCYVFSFDSSTCCVFSFSLSFGFSYRVHTVVPPNSDMPI